MWWQSFYIFLAWYRAGFMVQKPGKLYNEWELTLNRPASVVNAFKASGIGGAAAGIKTTFITIAGDRAHNSIFITAFGVF